jgi:predicted lipid carrier protein YhbT
MRTSVYLPLRAIPEAMHTHLLARFINHMLRGQSLVQRLEELNGKFIALHLKDVGITFTFQIENGCLVPASAESANVTISGPMQSFWLLASQNEDPDTLFFQRTLSIEGETETGVHIKNIMDALDYDVDAHIDDVLFRPLAGPVKQVISQVRKLHAEYKKDLHH